MKLLKEFFEVKIHAQMTMVVNGVHQESTPALIRESLYNFSRDQMIFHGWAIRRLNLHGH